MTVVAVLATLHFPDRMAAVCADCFPQDNGS